LTPRKTKDERAGTDILGKALMNYAIPDTYAVRYHPISPTKRRSHWNRIIPIKNANRHRNLMPSDKGELFRQRIWPKSPIRIIMLDKRKKGSSNKKQHYC